MIQLWLLKLGELIIHYDDDVDDDPIYDDDDREREIYFPSLHIHISNSHIVEISNLET